MMSIQFLYEDGKDAVVDEYGRPEPMDYIVDEEQYRLETLSSYTQYLSILPQQEDNETEAIHAYRRQYQDKVRFFKLFFEKCLSASAAAKQLGIHARTAQRWAKQYERDPDSIFEKQCFDENPSAVLEQVMEQLRQAFTGHKPVDRNNEEKIQERLDWIRKWEKTDMGFTRNCVFLDESAFHINMKRSVVMDNTPIHTSEDIAKYITSHGYRCAYLPSYSPELNPIEQLWSVVKSKVKRNKLLEKETLMMRISEASNSLKLSDFEGFVWHSHKCLDKCRNKQEL
ncbi:hypothetical protein VTP01DRAFT_2021 [Rhizomucor pusillus]|uniref:uncharacterized protein n=1 Tax=Rhizomucor pusillus TaxID=4840 RepID=UPI0037438F6A